MTDVNDVNDTVMLEPENVVMSATDRTEEEQGLDHIPPSLLRYFDTSRSRAAACEKLILEEREDEGGTNKRIENQKRLSFEMRTHETLNEKQRTGSPEDDTRTRQEQEQTEEDFQRELRKIMEAEKQQQQELELMEQRAQEKLEEEFLLQQEMIIKLQRRVEEEKKKREEEQKRMKEEKERRKEEERRRVEEETRRKKEEERKTEELKRKEEERKNKEEMRRMREEKKREEERKRKELVRKLEEEKRMIEEEEMREVKEGVERMKREEERRRMKEGRMMKKDEWRDDRTEGTKMEKQNMGREEEGRKSKEEERKERWSREKKEEDEDEGQKRTTQVKICGELRRADEGEDMTTEERKMKEEGYKKRKEDEEKEESKRKQKEVKMEMSEEGERRTVGPQGEEEEEQIGEQEEEEDEETEGKERKAVQNGGGEPTTSCCLSPPHRDPRLCPPRTEATPQRWGESPRPAVTPPPAAAQRRISWMKDCISWSDLSIQNWRKHRGPPRSRRGARRPPEGGAPPALPPASLLRATGCTSLQEVTSLTLEDSPACSLSTLALCPQLGALRIRRCGLRALGGLSKLKQLRFIDVQENHVSSVDCQDMRSLRVLLLAHNHLTSIHGLDGAENLEVLELSHNSITRIAGLESTRGLQRLCLDHNQLVSTRGLGGIYTLLHLSCSHNHLMRAEGLENLALLGTLDLRANSLLEPPQLNNQVLLRELHLDDNNISSLGGLTACWLPLLQRLSAAHNRVTQLPPMSALVSLSHLDLRSNSLSELQELCGSLEGCGRLREVLLSGNPLQVEAGWRCALQRAVPGLRALDGVETGSCVAPPADDSFLMFCQDQLQETRDLQRRHRWELSDAPPLLDAAHTWCRHLDEALRLAVEHRFAHERGDTSVADRWMADRTSAEAAPPIDEGECCQTETPRKAPPSAPSSDPMGPSSASQDSPDVQDAFHPETPSNAGPGSVSMATKSTSASPVSDQRDPDPKSSTAAVVIQQRWRTYRQKCENFSGRSAEEERGGGAAVGSNTWRAGGRDQAATVIQAFWRGVALRRGLTAALAAVTCLDAGEDPALEDLDLEDFVFDEAVLENSWVPLCGGSVPRSYPVPLCGGSVPRSYLVPEQPPPLKFQAPGPVPEAPPHGPTPVRGWRQAWASLEQVAPSPTSNRSSPPASALSSRSDRSERILGEWGFTHRRTALLMLQRAQRMKARRQQPKTPPGGARPPSGTGSEPATRRDACLGGGRVEPEETKPLLHGDSGRFLPEISSDVLKGGRVQLVADPGRRHQARGLRTSSTVAVQPSRENALTRHRLSGATPAATRGGRISFRDNPVQRSGGWGGGKKRNRK
ncbi:leucine-rich repeat and IQ domain-containing protein 1 [Antennarius striatus]|uniref:leucine-rich repeat and IQ domain-containing protein 1 n=1 Tax=Antennarius striatus TaxID=241820 RepID=UPI0035B1CBA8